MPLSSTQQNLSFRPLLVMIAVLVALLALPLVATAQDGIEVSVVSEYDLIWNDAGSGADKDGSFWRPMPTDGWYRVGHHLKANHGKPDTPTMVVRPLRGGMIAEPVDYQWLWSDGGSGSDADGSVWRPLCSDGFQALGDVAQRGYNKPSLSEVVCVNASVLVRAEEGSFLWADGGSGGDHDFSGWGVKYTQYYETIGLFIGNSSYSRPSAGLFYAIGN